MRPEDYDRTPPERDHPPVPTEPEPGDVVRTPEAVMAADLAGARGGDAWSSRTEVNSAGRIERTPPERDHPPEQEEPEPGDVVHTPDSVKESYLRGDTTADGRLDRVRGRGVDWVRPTDLLARASARLAGRGIDLQTRLVYRSRAAVKRGAVRAVDRARKLPPLSAFGRGPASRLGAERSAIARS